MACMWEACNFSQQNITKSLHNLTEGRSQGGMHADKQLKPCMLEWLLHIGCHRHAGQHMRSAAQPGSSHLEDQSQALLHLKAIWSVGAEKK